MMKSSLFATLILASTLATASAFAEEKTAVVPVDNGVKQELSQDKAVVQSDKAQLKADKQKLREDRKAARIARKNKAHKRVKKEAQPVVQEQPKNG